MSEIDLTTESGQFANGLHGTLGNVQHEIRVMEERLTMERYAEMHATYRGMLAGWRICETALNNAMQERKGTADDSSR